MSTMRVNNATFYSFKGWSLSRKYYTSGRGHVSARVFDGSGEYLPKLLEDNGGLWPGLSGTGAGYFRFVVVDEDIDHGYPLMFDPTQDAVYNRSGS
jgi:hypothetical protein